ncbi:MAG: AAA-like domain-containing protein [Chloroflexota bacterium]
MTTLPNVDRARAGGRRRGRSDFFVAGGTLPPNVPSYVKRPADDELFELALSGKFCYVLTTRQMGKSSLMIRTARRLQAQEVQTAIIDLTEMGSSEPDTWYLDLLTELADELELSVEPEEWWQARASLGYVRRFTNFLRDVILTEIEGQVVIFIDEIDTTLRLPFSDDFFTAIRATYNARAKDPAFARLGFILIGVASPSDLIKDHTRTPFNIGQGIKLADFSLDSAGVLQDRLETLYAGQGAAIFSRVFHWTSGHPYLTQKLCQAIAQAEDQPWPADKIDALIEMLFLSEEARKETNLQFVQDSLHEHPHKRSMLQMYRRVYEGEEIIEDERSAEQNQLKLTGLVRAENGILKVRNQIYRRVFNLEWIKANLPLDIDASNFFVVGGTVRSDSPSYVKRPADDELYELALAGKFCYVLTPRQMGKSSLMIRTARHLEQQGVRTAIIDLTKIGRVTVEQWYLNLLTDLKHSLGLAVDPQVWWQGQAALGPVKGLTNFVREIILTEIDEQVVIFIDEIDTTLSLAFSDDFFAAIRAMYNARAADHEYNRLTFVLFGVATPSDLIKDRSRAPFNIGRGIDLDDFSHENTRALQHGLKDIYPDHGEAIFARIYHWTNGHPYLTQKLCLAAAEFGNGSLTDADVDGLVDKLFLSEEIRKESNLQFIQDKIQTSPEQRQLIKLYRQVYAGQAVPEDERSVIQNQLKLFGLVKARNGVLKVRNEIYRHVFNQNWIEANTPVDWTRRVAIASSLLVIVLIGVIGLALYWRSQQDLAQEYTTQFRATTNPDERIKSLAGLFDLPGFQNQAQDLFYTELTPEERLALFDAANPQTVGPQLITAVQGLYTDLENNERDNALLAAMLHPLQKIDDPRSVNLQVGIEQWLEGRKFFDEGQYPQAIRAYDVVIRLNDRNPGVYFDRALAYLALAELDPALADFETALGLDEGRQRRVAQIVLSNPHLYDEVIARGAANPAVVALVPSPTSTPTPTSTFTPTPTPTLTPTATPTGTPTPVPTDTPTIAPIVTTAVLPVLPTHTPTPTATPSPTATPTPRSVVVVFVQGSGENHQLGLANSAGDLLRENLHPRASAPTWSPDGAQVAFYGEPGISEMGGVYAQGSGVWLLELNSGKLEQLYSTEHVRNMSWAPQGDKLAIEWGPPNVPHQIVVIDTRDSSEISRFAGEQPTWSPDGQELVIKSCAPECGLWKVGFDGGGGQLLTSDSTDSYPTWSSTGQYIVFTSRARTGDWELYRLDLAASELARLTHRRGTDTTPMFSPDGLEIYYRSDSFGRDWRIMAISVDGRKERPIVDNVGSSNDWGLARPAVY